MQFLIFVFSVGAEHHLYRSAEHGPVWGIAVLQLYIYVVCYEYNQVLVYQVSDFKQLESISMLELDHPQDLAACSVYNCLFIADSAKASAKPDKKCVWKLNLNDPRNPVRFIEDLVFPNTLSVTPDGDILMVQQGTPPILKLFNGNNGNKKDITLPIEIQIPRHAVFNKKSGSYIVCHGGLNCDSFGVCAINSSGTLLIRYEPLQENLIRVPWHLACDSEGNIYIAGHRSHKILKLSSSLEYIKTLAYKADGVFFPLRIHYHDETENLFVGQWRGDALVIDGNIKPARWENITPSFNEYSSSYQKSHRHLHHRRRRHQIYCQYRRQRRRFNGGYRGYRWPWHKHVLTQTCLTLAGVKWVLHIIYRVMLCYVSPTKITKNPNKTNKLHLV